MLSNINSLNLPNLTNVVPFCKLIVSTTNLLFTEIKSLLEYTFVKGILYILYNNDITQTNKSLAELNSKSIKYPASGIWNERELFISVTRIQAGDRNIFWKNGDVQLTRANCDFIFGVCCIQNGSNVHPYPATVNGNGEWYSELSGAPAGVCNFLAIGFGRF